MAAAIPLAVEGAVVAAPVIATEAAVGGAAIAEGATVAGAFTAEEIAKGVALGLAAGKPVEKGAMATYKAVKGGVKEVKDVVGLGSTLYHGGAAAVHGAGKIFGHHHNHHGQHDMNAPSVLAGMSPQFMPGQGHPSQPAPAQPGQ